MDATFTVALGAGKSNKGRTLTSVRTSCFDVQRSVLTEHPTNYRVGRIIVDTIAATSATPASDA